MNKAITNRISSLMFGAIFATVLIIGATLAWIAAEQNRLSAEASRTMIAGGISGMIDTLEAIALDYTWWQPARDNISANNVAWVYDNMGTGVTESELLDLLVVVPASGATPYGWVKDGGEDLSKTILPAETIARVLATLDDVPVNEARVVTQFIRVGEHIYALSATRVLPDDLDTAGTLRLDNAIFGYRFDNDRVSMLGDGFLIDDMTLSEQPGEDQVSVAITDLAGNQLTNLVWAKPSPGVELLKRSIWPIGIALALFGLGAMAVAHKARSSAIALTRNEHKANQLARTDSLTGLPNRFAFYEHLNKITHGSGDQPRKMAAIYLDVDGFKKINDTVGHARGDELVSQIARRLAEALPDGALLSRVGGDEFNILIVDDDPGRAAQEIATSAASVFKQDFVLDGMVFSLSASTGYAYSDTGTLEPEAIVRKADVAMYEAKRTKTGTPLLYDPEYESATFKNQQIEQELRGALSRNEVCVNYQPIVDSGSGEMIMVEALARWTSSELGSVPPTIFIPIAEESGLIHALGDYVLRQVCNDLATWPDLRASVNLSPVQLRNPMLISSIMEILKETGMTADRIEIELTEGVIVTHPEIAREKLSQLKSLGFSISLDDFGTGFSSISYLRQLPFDKLKIDRSFVMELNNNAKASGLVQSIASLGRSLELSVVAEGVETDEEAKLSQLAGCNLLQGFLFAKPQSFAALVEQYRYGENPDRLKAS